MTKLRRKHRCTRGGKGEKCPRKNIDKHFEHTETQEGKTHLKINLLRDVKGNKQSFQKFIHSKKKTMENFGLLLNRAGHLMIKEADKDGVINAYLTSLLSKAAIRNPRSVWSM